jgi:hypothetical protein
MMGVIKSILMTPGKLAQHDGLTDYPAFFAEMTDSFLGSKGFDLSGASERSPTKLEFLSLLADLWGPLPDFAASPPAGNG